MGSGTVKLIDWMSVKTSVSTQSMVVSTSASKWWSGTRLVRQWSTQRTRPEEPYHSFLTLGLRLFSGFAIYRRGPRRWGWRGWSWIILLSDMLIDCGWWTSILRKMGTTSSTMVCRWCSLQSSSICVLICVLAQAKGCHQRLGRESNLLLLTSCGKHFESTMRGWFYRSFSSCRVGWVWWEKRCTYR